MRLAAGYGRALAVGGGLMHIRVKITRDRSNRVEVLELEEYLKGVLPSEIKAESCPMSAQQAQAIAARTYAVYAVDHNAKEPFDVDDTARYQAYNARPRHPRSDQAVESTKGKILAFRGKTINAVYTDSNGGRCVSAQKRWGSAIPYLIDKVDPWDNSPMVRGHGVGLSQVGAAEMGRAGKSYSAILSFYYPGASIKTMDGKEGDSMATTLRMGSKGAAVRRLQAQLGLPIDGIFGEKTLSALKLFQAEHGLSPDGIAGPKTNTVLDKFMPKKPMDFKQFDARWSKKRYSAVNDPKQTIRSSGCAPTVMADYIYDRFDKTVTPPDLCNLALQWKCRTANSGTGWGFFELCGKHWGFKVERTKDLNQVIAALAKGKRVIVSVGKGYFTNGGHIMLIWMCDGDSFHVCNPGSSSKAKALLSVFRSQAKQYFILG